MSMIVTASLGTCGKSTICLWTFKHPDKKRNVPAQTNNVTITTIVEFVIHLAILLAAFAFVYQNVTVRLQSDTVCISSDVGKSLGTSIWQ